MELRSMLDNMGLLADHRPALGTGVPQYRFYVSDMANQFQQFANSIIKYGILASEKIDIHTYSSAPLSAGEKS
jgi:glutamate racemase